MKIGDIVVVKTGLVPEEQYGKDIFVEEMIPYCGQQAKIVDKSDYGWFLDIDEDCYTFTDEMLDLVDKSVPDIIITVRGGLVQCIHSTVPNLIVHVNDHDNDENIIEVGCNYEEVW